MTKHPSLDIVESQGTELSGKKVVLCVAGSVAAYKSIELANLDEDNNYTDNKRPTLTWFSSED